MSFKGDTAPRRPYKSVGTAIIYVTSLLVFHLPFRISHCSRKNWNWIRKCHHMYHHILRYSYMISESCLPPLWLCGTRWSVKWHLKNIYQLFSICNFFTWLIWHLLLMSMFWWEWKVIGSRMYVVIDMMCASPFNSFLIGFYVSRAWGRSFIAMAASAAKRIWLLMDQEQSRRCFRNQGRSRRRRYFLKMDSWGLL